MPFSAAHDLTSREFALLAVLVERRLVLAWTFRPAATYDCIAFRNAFALLFERSIS